MMSRSILYLATGTRQAFLASISYEPRQAFLYCVRMNENEELHIYKAIGDFPVAVDINATGTPVASLT